MLNSSPKKVLLVKNRAMGDAVMGLSCAEYLKTILPLNSKIIFAIPEWIFPLFQNVETAVDEFIPLSLKTVRKTWGFYRNIKTINPDWIHECHLSGRTAKFFQFFCKLKHIPYSFHDHSLQSPRTQNFPIRDQGKLKPLIQRDLDGLFSGLAHFFPEIHHASDAVPNYLTSPPQMKPSIDKTKEEAVIFGIVATRETKMWPLSSFVSLAKSLLESGKFQKILIPLSPSQSDQNLKEKWKKLSVDIPQEKMEFVETPLAKLPLEMARAKAYVGNDTGLKHIAVALNIPTLTFFGPELPLEWHPYSAQKHPFFFREGLECRTREAHYCGLTTCDSMICLNQFSALEVHQFMKENF